MVHSPQSYDELKNANSYLAYEEMYLFMYNLKIVEKENKQVENNFSFADSNFVKIFCKALPFQLTNGQTEALSDIFKDLTSETITSRLIQGDVGCGKTMVALISLLFAVENNHQAAFMVPTEVLARQHYDETVRLLKNAGTEINVRLLTSQTSKKEKQMILEELKLGFPILVIGTHSVINATDAFTDLALVFVDEQHKFGVNQREEIVKNHPHVVTMTATPIPRSLSLTLYGNDSVSEIKELPSGRLPIKSCKISEKKLNDAFLFIEREVEHKHQAYVVCPAIEDAEGIEIYSVDKVVDILNTNFPQIKAEGIHGKTSKENRERIMREYKNGNIDVLVSTTVIEVGINVPNATTMMIMNAERFGLATLHQLRGRVGRGTLQSYCILIDCLETETSAERLDTIVKSNNGFEIAEADLVQRGPGELLGTEQSGMWNFKKADISDTKMLQLVLKDVALQENTSTTHHLAKC
jgi:ATP-dependent DNA helicase RecG